jgi:hypothetical protein
LGQGRGTADDGKGQMDGKDDGFYGAADAWVGSGGWVGVVHDRQVPVGG